MPTPYTNNAGVLFADETSGLPIATQAYATAADTAVSGDSHERQSITATSDGLTTGTITPTVTTVRDMYIAVQSADANNIVVLPQYGDSNYPRRVTLFVGATGFELRSASPVSVGINGGLGAAAESAIPANTVVTCVRTSSTGAGAWICMNQSSNGTVSATEVAA